MTGGVAGRIGKRAVRYGMCILGIMLTSLSTAIFQLAGLGTDPVQVLISGLAKTAGIPYGQMITIFNVGICILLLVLARKYVREALFLSAFLSGFLVDGYIGILRGWLCGELPVAVRFGAGVAGCFIMAGGIYLYLFPGLGASPTEGIGLYLAGKSHMDYGRMRMRLDVFFTIAGWLLGGNMGVITVVAAVATGPVVSGMERLFHHKLTRT